MTLLATISNAPKEILAGTGLYSIWEKAKPVVITGLVAIGAIKVIIHIQRQRRRKKWNSVGKDVVVLHMFPRGRVCPSISPFVLKLETYLKMAKIPYEVDFDQAMGPKGKCPWITLNGEDMADTQMIIESLNNKFGKDFNKNLTPEQKAIGLSMRVMTEQHLFWCMLIWRVIADKGQSIKECIKLPRLFLMMMPLLRKQAVEYIKKMDLGRHTVEEVEKMGIEDLRALSTWLGDKPYFMGDEPTEVDCAMFGALAQFEWNSPRSVYVKMFEGELKNLSDYCLRMKERFWPDWNKFLNPIQE